MKGKWFKYTMNEWLKIYSEYVERRLTYVKNNNDNSAELFKKSYWQHDFLSDKNNLWIYNEIRNASFKSPKVSDNIIDEISNIIGNATDEFIIYVFEFIKALILQSQKEHTIPCLNTAFWNEVSGTKRSIMFIRWQSEEKDTIDKILAFLSKMDLIYYEIVHS